MLRFVVAPHQSPSPAALITLQGSLDREASNTPILMIALAFSPILGAAGYSILYMLGGGGLGVAILIFIVAKMFGK